MYLLIHLFLTISIHFHLQNSSYNSNGHDIDSFVTHPFPANLILVSLVPPTALWWKSKVVETGSRSPTLLCSDVTSDTQAYRIDLRVYSPMRSSFPLMLQWFPQWMLMLPCCQRTNWSSSTYGHLPMGESPIQMSAYDAVTWAFKKLKGGLMRTTNVPVSLLPILSHRRVLAFSMSIFSFKV